MKTRKTSGYFFNILAALVLLMMIPGISVAAVPLTINYQGYLTDSNGDPVDTATEPGGTIQILFSLHDALSVGNELWSEEQAVQVVQGVYNVQLGATAFPQSMTFNEPYFLEVAIDENTSGTYEESEKLSPRQQLTAVPYALNADTVDGMDSGEFAASSHNHSGTEINTGTVAEPIIDTAIARTTDVSSAVSTHTSDSSAHHMKYTDTNAVNAVQTASYITILETRITALEAKLANVTADATNIYITGANLHVLNGNNSTASGGGLGNLIIGYNESRGTGLDDRNGSHNLVIGTRNNFSWYGGIVVGEENTISAPYASVTGGFQNIAGAYSSTVTGGSANTASGYNSSISGGDGNTASGMNSSILGGDANIIGDSAPFADTIPSIP